MVSSLYYVFGIENGVTTSCGKNKTSYRNKKVIFCFLKFLGWFLDLGDKIETSHPYWTDIIRRSPACLHLLPRQYKKS